MKLSNETNNLFDIKLLNSEEIICQDILTSNQFNFTGLESATDYLISEFSNSLNTHPLKESIKVNEINLKGCKHLTIWSLYYLNKTFNKTLNDLKIESLQQVAGCDEINQNLVVSFIANNNDLFQSKFIYSHIKIAYKVNYFLELGLFTTSKVLIINEDTQRPFLIDLIQNKTENKIESNQFFDYLKFEKSNKTINLYESSEVYIIYFFTFFFILNYFYIIF